MSGGDALGSSRRLRVALVLAGVAVLVAAAAGVYWSAGQGAKPQSAGAPGIPSMGAPRPLPEVRFQNAEGKSVALSDFRGKTVLLNVWATWCAPCREEMPALDRLQQKLGGSGLEVVALAIEQGGPAAIRQFYEQTDVRSLAIYIDPSMEASARLKALGLPTTLLIDREGRERWRKLGPAEWDSAAVMEALRGFL